MGLSSRGITVGAKSKAMRGKLKFKHMKKIIYLFGGFTFSCLPMGILLKIMHWPGAGILLVLGTMILSFVLVPAIAIHFYRRKTDT